MNEKLDNFGLAHAFPVGKLVELCPGCIRQREIGLSLALAVGLCLLGFETQIDITFTPLPAVIQHVKDGRLKALGVTSSNRWAPLADIPTIAESGIPGYEVTQWWGLTVPAKTPDSVIKKIQDVASVALNGKEVAAQLQGIGAEVKIMTPKEMDAMINAEIADWKTLVTAAGIKPE